MKIIIKYGLIIVLALVSCSNSERQELSENTTDKSNVPQKSYKHQFSGRLTAPFNNDSVYVYLHVSERDLILIHVNEDKRRDTTHINEVNNVSGIFLFDNAFFGLEVKVRCGSDCVNKEYYLFIPVKGSFKTALIIKSFEYHSLDKVFDKRIDSLNYIHERSEYVGKVINISRNDNSLLLYESQNEEYHYYKQTPYNFSKEHILLWDSTNSVFCNSYIYLSGEYKCVSDIDYSREMRQLNSRNIPCFKSLKHTYIFLEGKWAILNEEGENEVVFMN